MGTQKNILIVDDIELNRAILGELFHDKYNIIEAENGVEAIEALERLGESVAVVLLDIVMPVMDGFGVLTEMMTRQWIGRIPVVMITSETSADVMQRGYEMGAADIISKPFAPNIIRQRIHNIVEQYTYKFNLEKLVEQQTDALRSQARKLRENSIQIIDILSAVIEFKNTESVNHIHNIRTFTRLMMCELSVNHSEYNITDDMVEIISEAAAMHDIGKVAIPDHILNKPSKLTIEEFEIMKTHTIKGCEILEKLSSVQYLDYYDYCYEICRHHHERWDGKGYPDGLVGDEIPIWAQVVSLSDVYDALTSKRVYKDAYTVEMAIEMILAGDCGAFNPIIIECFMSIVHNVKNGIGEYDKQNKNIGNEKEIIHIEPKQFIKEDISSRTLRLLELERQKYKIMSELSEEILFEYDRKADRLTFSEKYQLITGHDLVIQNFKSIIYDNDIMKKEFVDMLMEGIAKITVANPICKLEMQINFHKEQPEWYGVYLYPIWDTDYEAQCVGYIGKLINIERQKQENYQLQEAADNDPLTGLLNRNALKKYAEIFLSSNKEKSSSLCFIDIDNFKSVNDHFGHLFGDAVLKRVSAILTSCLRDIGLVGRIGGDEFAVFFYDVKTELELGKKLEFMSDSLCENFDGCNMSGSIGSALSPRDGDNFDTLLRKADQALYMSKRMGKNRYQIYRSDCDELPFKSMQSCVDTYDIAK